MICNSCGMEVDEKRFNKCPYCMKDLRPSDKIEYHTNTSTLIEISSKENDATPVSSSNSNELQNEDKRWISVHDLISNYKTILLTNIDALWFLSKYSSSNNTEFGCEYVIDLLLSEKNQLFEKNTKKKSCIALNSFIDELVYGVKKRLSQFSNNAQSSKELLTELFNIKISCIFPELTEIQKEELLEHHFHVLSDFINLTDDESKTLINNTYSCLQIFKNLNNLRLYFSELNPPQNNTVAISQARNITENILVSHISAFSTRTKNALKQQGINTIADLKTINLEDFAKEKNVGQTTINEIKSFLSTDSSTIEIDQKDIKLKDITSVIEDWKNFPIIGLADLDIRSKNSLNKMGIEFVYQMYQLDPLLLTTVKGAGTGTIERVKSVILQINKLFEGTSNQTTIDISNDLSNETIITDYSLGNLFEEISEKGISEILQKGMLPKSIDGITNETKDKLNNLVYKQLGLDKIKEENLDYPVVILDCIPDGKSLSAYLLSMGYISINDFIRGLTIDFLMDKSTKIFATGILKTIELLKQPSKFISDEYLTNNLDVNSRDIILCRSKNDSLEVIGHKYGVTRERIRQIEAKTISCLRPFTEMTRIIVTGNESNFKGEAISDSLNNTDLSEIIVYCLKNDSSWEYISSIDLFIKNNTTEKHFHDSKLQNVMTNFAKKKTISISKDFISLTEELAQYGYDFLSAVDMIKLFNSYGYKRYGDYIVFGSMPQSTAIYLMMKKYFPNGIKTTEYEIQTDSTDLADLRGYISNELGISVAKNNHALSSSIGRITILRDQGKQILEESTQVNLMELDKLIPFIDSELENVDSLSYSYIYKAKKNWLELVVGIDNHEYLHGLLLHFYPNRYKYTKSYLIKMDSKLADNDCNIEDKLANYTIENDGYIRIDDFLTRLKTYSKFSVLQHIYDSNLYINWGSQCFRLKSSINIPAAIHTNLKAIIDKSLAYGNGYTNARYLFEKSGLSEIVKKEIMVETYAQLFSICEFLFSSDYDFSRPHITQKGLFSNGISYENIFNHILNYPEIYKLNVLDTYIEKLLIPDISASGCKSTLIDKCIRISKNELLKKELFFINEDNLTQITNIIREKMKEDYFSLITFDDFNLFPDIGYNWNKYLLYSIIKEYLHQYRLILTGRQDYRICNYVVIPDNSRIQTYSQLVANTMKLSGQNHLSSSEMEAFLVLKGLTIGHISIELKDSDDISFINDYYVIK